MRSPHTATKSSPRLPQLEKARAQQWRPNTAKNKSINKQVLSCESSTSQQRVRKPHSPSQRTVWLVGDKSKCPQGRNRQCHLATQHGEEKWCTVGKKRLCDTSGNFGPILCTFAFSSTSDCTVRIDVLHTCTFLSHKCQKEISQLGSALGEKW